MIIRRGFSFLRIFSSLSPRKENIFCVFFFVKKCDNLNIYSRTWLTINSSDSIKRKREYKC